MKKTKLVFYLVSLLCFMGANQALAAGPGGYMSFHFGLVSLEDSNWSFGGGIPDDTMTFSNGIAIMGAGGYDFGRFRIEGEFAYAYNEVDQYRENFIYNSTFNATDGAMDSTSLMVNCYFDIENRSLVTPYLMGGIGFAYIELYDVILTDGVTTLFLYDQDDTVFAYQIGIGVDFSFTETVSMDINYRYLDTSDLEFSGVDVEYGSHRVLIGVRICF